MPTLPLFTFRSNKKQITHIAIFATSPEAQLQPERVGSRATVNFANRSKCRTQKQSFGSLITMGLSDESVSPFQINIVPMIDAIFSLLAFFIISTLYLTPSEGLPVNLPKAVTAQTLRQTQINVTISADGKIALNRQPIELQKLEDRVRALVRPNAESLVVINADERVVYGRVVSVMDRLNQVKGVKLALAAQKQ